MGPGEKTCQLSWASLNPGKNSGRKDEIDKKKASQNNGLTNFMNHLHTPPP